MVKLKRYAVWVHVLVCVGVSGPKNLPPFFRRYNTVCSHCRGAAMAMSAKEQMSKMLDQLMGQNRDGELDNETLIYSYIPPPLGAGIPVFCVCIVAARVAVLFAVPVH